MDKRTIWLTLVLLLALQGIASAQVIGQRWSKEKAAAWQRETGWIVGSNFSPSTAINQLEMWQADTFDPKTIDRELALAEQLGFNTMRVFLHHLLWQQDPQGFLSRIDQYLAIADRHKIRTMFVLFDSCWDPLPRPGKQRDPKPRLHNSGWVQSPGAEILSNPARYDELEGYVKGVIGRFKNDRRVLIWDLHNEPDNNNRNSYFAYEPVNKGELAMQLLKKTWTWAREVNPSQPLTAAPWWGTWKNPESLPGMNGFLFSNSDVITFHQYADLATTRARVEELKATGRPVICTEYMARPVGSTFEAILPYFKEQMVGAYNWGFVEGKTQTNYPWDSWDKDYQAEPPVWFHDIFRTNGTPYRVAEVELISSLTKKN